MDVVLQREAHTHAHPALAPSKAPLCFLPHICTRSFITPHGESGQAEQQPPPPPPPSQHSTAQHSAKQHTCTHHAAGLLRVALRVAGQHQLAVELGGAAPPAPSHACRGAAAAAAATEERDETAPLNPLHPLFLKRGEHWTAEQHRPQAAEAVQVEQRNAVLRSAVQYGAVQRSTTAHPGNWSSRMYQSPVMRADMSSPCLLTRGGMARA